MKSRTLILYAAGLLLLTVQGFPADENARKGSPWNTFETERWSQLIDKDIIGRSGTRLGSVSEAIIDESGSIRYIVFSHGGILGVGGRLIPVPVSAIHQDTKGNLVINVDKEQLADSPYFYPGNWSWVNFADQIFTKQLDDYYGNFGSTNGSQAKVHK